MFIFLSYPWFADTLFLCSNALSSLPPLLEFRTAHAVGDVAISAPAFPFPLTSPLDMLIGKELRPMVIPAKSWPMAFDITHTSSSLLYLAIILLGKLNNLTFSLLDGY